MPQRQHLVLQNPLSCQVTFSGDQGSDEEKIRKLPLMRSRSDRHFLLGLRAYKRKGTIIQTRPQARHSFEVVRAQAEHHGLGGNT